MNSSDIDMFQTYLIRLGNWAVENEMKINPGKSKAVSFTNATVMEQINYNKGHQLISEVNLFKYLGINIHSNLNWVAYVNYILGIALKTLHFIIYMHKLGNNNKKPLAYTALVRPILDYCAVC